MNSSAFENFPILTSERLRLRLLCPDDFAELIKLCNDKSIADQIINIPFPYAETDAINRLHFVRDGYLNKRRYVFAITFPSDNKLIGEIGIHLEENQKIAQIGYWIGAPYRNLGIASEACGCILKFGFKQLQLHKIYATYYPENLASGKVMQKNKMIKEAEMKDHLLIDGNFKSLIQYRLIKTEYENL